MKITLTAQAIPTSRPGNNDEWKADAIVDGAPATVYYEFTPDEVAAAGNDPASYPWDEDHITRIDYEDA